jgi:hypothetical protein
VEKLADLDASPTHALTQMGDLPADFEAKVETSPPPMPAMPEPDLRRFLAKPVLRHYIASRLRGCPEPDKARGCDTPRLEVVRSGKWVDFRRSRKRVEISGQRRTMRDI